MKELITAAQIAQAVDRKQSAIYVEPGTIITPAAKDTARDNGVKIIVGSPVNRSTGEVPDGSAAAVNIEMIAKIVSDILSGIGQPRPSAAPVKVADANGLRLVRGSGIVLEQLSTGDPNETVKIKELIGIRESAGLAAGLITFDNTLATHHYRHDEIDYILEGGLSCTISDAAYSAQAGDIIYIPAGLKVNFTALTPVKMFYVAIPCLAERSPS